MQKTAKGLVEYALAQLGRPYWYGTFGQAICKALYDQKKRQYPQRYEWEYTPAAEGKKGHDCVGLYKGYLWCNDPQDGNPVYNKAQDLSANGLRNACKTKGKMATMPEIPGLLVFFDGHVGVYVGNGEVVEARSRRYGVYKSKLAERPWTEWGYAPDIIYEEPEQAETVKTISVDLPVLKKGAKGETVRAMQNLLIAAGYEMKSEDGKKVYGADGSFGGATEKALKAYQSANGLDPDGSCGRKTWTKLLGVS